MSQIYKNIAAGGQIPIETILGDTGSITGTTVKIYADQAAQNCGSSVAFNNSGTTSTFNVTDGIQNTIIGQGSGNATLSGEGNTSLGWENFEALTSGQFNVAVGIGVLQSLTHANNNIGIGENTLALLTTGTTNTALGTALGDLLTGSNNIAIGHGAGSNYTSSESGNILINNTGVVGESNVTRLGNLQQKCFIAGITGVTVSNPQIVTINSSTGQLGVTTLSGNNVTIVTTSTYQVLVSDDFIGINYAGAQTTTLEASPATGRTLTIKDISGLAGSNNITISGNGNNIDGASTYVINANYGSVTLVYNGSTGWSVI